MSSSGRGLLDSSDSLAHSNYATFSPSMPDSLEVPGARSSGGGANGTTATATAATSSDSANGGVGRVATFNQGSDEEMRLGSRVTFTDRTDNDDYENGNRSVTFEMSAEDTQKREQWDNKMQFYMGVISYAVGLGNVWRFPYLCQKNGGGAFLIPYCIMMVLGGLPLFLIELGIGQRLRTGPVGVWNAIHPYLGGIGISEAVVSYLVALYYNVIVTWCLYYFYQSFTLDLPWASCPKVWNGSVEIDDHECKISSSPTMYFWNRKALETTGSIGELEGFNWHLTIALVIAWILIYLCVMKGIKSSGKVCRPSSSIAQVMYATATFPYVVTTIFLIRSLALEGAIDGLRFMIHPDLTMLTDPKVWLDAATQIFYSMGLGFGGLIAFGSYNPQKNDCKRDAYLLSFVNVVTSLYTAVVVFCVVGFMAHKTMHGCIEDDMMIMSQIYPQVFPSFDAVRGNFTDEAYTALMDTKFVGSSFELMGKHSQLCNYQKLMLEAASGTGLAFVVFTEAIVQFPFPPVWSVLFFLMLISLGLGSMFGTLEGVITSLNDSQIITVKKPIITLVLCASACLIGLIFSTKGGQYWVSLFDQFAGSYGLLCVAFMELIAVVYVYGYDRFARDIEFMTGSYPSKYWTITWRFVAPIILFCLFSASVIESYQQPPTYFAYDIETGKTQPTAYPLWALFIALAMVVSAIAPLPLVFFVRKFKILAAEPNIPAAAKRLNATQSTSYMLKSEQSFNRMTESSISVAEMEPLGNGARTSNHGHH